MTLALTLLALMVGVAMSAVYFRRTTAQYMREHYIRSFVFPRHLLKALEEQNPGVDERAQFLIARALRTFFLVHLRADGRVIGMPSKAADALWHEFILDTKAYNDFCSGAFGTFFHHIPATSMQKDVYANESLQRTWRLACLDDNINPKAATRLPLLFALDAKIGFPNGNTFSLAGKRREESSSGCGSFSGAGDGGSSGNGSADGSGCSGGCGGGCGG